jgi:hypothetical protein
VFDLELNATNLKAIFSETFYEKYMPHDTFHKKCILFKAHQIICTDSDNAILLQAS